MDIRQRVKTDRGLHRPLAWNPCRYLFISYFPHLTSSLPRKLRITPDAQNTFQRRYAAALGRSPCSRPPRQCSFWICLTNFSATIGNYLPASCAPISFAASQHGTVTPSLSPSCTVWMPTRRTRLDRRPPVHNGTGPLENAR